MVRRINKEATPKKTIFRRAHRVEPQIDPREIERLHELLRQEEFMEADMKRDMNDIVRARDRELARELRRMEERNRHLILWIGVTLLMVIIATFWVFSLLGTIGKQEQATAIQPHLNIQETKEALDGTMKKVLSGLDELQKESERLKNNPVSSTSDIAAPIKPSLPVVK